MTYDIIIQGQVTQVQFYHEKAAATNTFIAKSDVYSRKDSVNTIPSLPSGISCKNLNISVFKYAENMTK